MSGIYIKGMERPTEGTVIAIYKLNGKFYASVHGTELCPLIPVPDHGDLIERDALMGQMERNLWAIEDKAEKELGFDETLRRGMQYGHAVCVDAVNNAPTIIPADEEGET